MPADQNNKLVEKVRRNIARMIDQGAPEVDIDSYIASEGLTLEEVRGVGAGFSGHENWMGIDWNAVLEGVPGAARMAGGMIGTGAGAVAGGAAGLPTGPGAVATAGAGAIMGNVLLAETFGQAADIFVDYVQGRKKSPWQRGYEAVMNMGVDAILMGAGGEISYLFRRTPTAARNLLRNERAVQLGEDLAEAGVNKKGAALLVGSRTTQGIVDLQRSLPLSSDIHEKAIQGTLDDIARYADDMARSAGGTADEPFRAGEIVRQGMENYAQRMDSHFAGRFAKFSSLSDFRGSTMALKEEAQAIKDEIIKSRVGSVPEFVERLLDPKLTPNQLPFEELRIMRSSLARVGRNASEEVAGRSMNAAKRLAAKVDEGMEAIGKNLDGEAFKQFREASAEYKDAIKRLERLRDVRHGERAIDAWNAATRGTNRDPGKLLDLKASLTPAEFGEYVSARVLDMGMETKGQGATLDRAFSAERFLSSWRDLAPDVRDALFGKRTPLREGVERMARFGGALRESRGMANPRGTGSKVGTYITLAVAGGAVVSAHHGDWGPAMWVGGMLGMNIGAAKLMTNPRFVNWLADGALVSPANHKGLAAHVTRLAGIAKDDPEARPYLQQYINGLSEWVTRKAVGDALSGRAEGQTAAEQAKKPLAQRFAETSAPYTEQEAALARITDEDQRQWRRSMRAEAGVMRIFRRTNRDVAQIDERLADLERQGGSRHAVQERARLERVRARLMNEALDFQGAMYGG